MSTGPYPLHDKLLDFFDLFLIHLGYGLPLHFHCWSDFPSRNAEVARQYHPLLNLLSIADRLSISAVNAFLDPSHNVGVGTLDNILNSGCIATNRPRKECFDI